MKLVKLIARNIVFPVIIGLGIEKLFTLGRNKKLVNLIFHGVVNTDSSHFCARHINSKQFENLIKYFKLNFDIISVDEAFLWKQQGIKPKRHTLSISFDDGYENNLINALPILEKYKIPATICISGRCFSNETNPLLWHDIIDAMDYFYKNVTYNFNYFRIKNFHDINSGKHIYDIVKESSVEDRDNALEKLCREFNLVVRFQELPGEQWRLLNRNQIKELASSKLITIASHGYNHYNLGLIAFEKAIHELDFSKKIIEENLGVEVSIIAYPDGSYTREIVDKAYELGYAKQLAVPYNFIEDVNDSRIISREGFLRLPHIPLIFFT